MTEEHLNLLTLTNYYCIKSTKTNAVYIDNNNRCFLYEVKSEAEGNFSGKDIEILPLKNYAPMYLTEVYAVGADKLCIVSRGNKETDIPIGVEDIKKQHMYHRTNQLIHKLQETGMSQYLYDLKRENVICPISIEPRYPKQYQKIHYCIVGIRNKWMFLLFTSLNEFNKWNETQKSNWNPLELTFEKLSTIRKKSGVLINPLSNSLLLTHEQLVKMEKGSQ